MLGSKSLQWEGSYEAAKNELVIEKILRSYVKPIKQLTENFPNHEVELQIEFQVPTKRIPSQRRAIFYQQPKINYRRDMETEYPYDFGPGYTKKVTVTTTTSTTVPPTVVTSPPTTSPTTAETVRSKMASITEYPERKPVYLDDLQKVFDEFAEKIKSTKCAVDHATTNAYPPQIIISNPGPVHGSKNIHDVIELIRKGVKVKKHVPRPRDEDLDWLRIKIPT